MDPDSYWTSLVFKVDEEIQRLEHLAKPDEAEMNARQAIEKEPSNLDNYNTLATILIEKNRHEEAIPVLLDILTIDRNWKKEGVKKP